MKIGRWINGVFALFWLICFVTYICGVYEPSGFIIAVAMLNSALAFTIFHFEVKGSIK